MLYFFIDFLKGQVTLAVTSNQELMGSSICQIEVFE